MTTLDAEAATASGVNLPGPEELPVGPKRALAEALQGLYRSAGAPSVRRIAQAVLEDDLFADTVSHQKVADMLHGTGVPKWSKYQPVVRVLAGWSTPRRDPDREARRFKQLWDEAMGAADGLADLPPVPEAGRLRSAFVLGGVTGETAYPDFEEDELAQFCHRLGEALSRASVDLIICSPFPDSGDFHALRGYLEAGGTGTIHMHSPRHLAVDDEFAQLWAMLGPSMSARVKNWHYPGPETAAPEALAQSWLLCQLMAIEHADVVIAVGGRVDQTASTILHLAEARQQPIIPFTFLGGAAERAYGRRDWPQVYPGLDMRRLADKNTADDVVVFANRMVTTRLHAGSTGPRPTTVFVSRASADAAYGEVLGRQLVAARLTVLFGDLAVQSDRTIEASIEDAVLRSDLFIALWSRSFAASPYCYDELQLGLQRHRAGSARLWIINLDGSTIVPPGARALPQVVARTPHELISVATALLAGLDNSE